MRPFSLKKFWLIVWLILTVFTCEAANKCPYCGFKNADEDRYCLDCARETRSMTKAEKLKTKRFKQGPKVETINSLDKMVEIEEHLVKDAVTIFVFHGDWSYPTQTLINYAKNTPDVYLKLISMSHHQSPIGKKYSLCSLPSMWVYDHQRNCVAKRLSNFLKGTALSDRILKHRKGVVSKLDGQNVGFYRIMTPQAEVPRMIFSPDGKLLATGNQKVVYLWNIHTGKQVAAFDGHSYIYAISFSPDGTRIVSAGFDKVIRIWDVEQKKLEQSWKTNKVIWFAHFLADGSRLVTAGKTITLWNINSGEKLRSFGKPAETKIESFALSPDRKTIAASFEHSKATINLWQVITGEKIMTLQPKGRGMGIEHLAFGSDGKKLASVYSGEVLLWELSSGEQIDRVKTPGRASHIMFSPGGEFLAGGTWKADEKEAVWIYDIDNQKLVFSFARYKHPIYRVVFSPDRKYLAMSSKQKNVIFWRLENLNIY
ncbi:hypothetical protein ACFLQ1_02095 [Candidatus Auribacterota bacterium]